MRLLLSTLAGTILCLTAVSGAASAQQSDRVYRIGLLNTSLPDSAAKPIEQWTGPVGDFRDALRDRGYVVGKNLVIELRHAQGDVARLGTVAEAFVVSKVDVIVSIGTAPTIAAIQATKSIPIVFVAGNPVEKGMVASLAKPGGNVTGYATTVCVPKMWQLLRDVAPATRRAGLLVYGPNIVADKGIPDIRTFYVSMFRSDAAAVGIEMIDMSVDALDEIEPKVAALASRGDAAIYIFTDTTLFSWRASIMAMASRYRLPTVCSQWLEWGETGCVITYGEDTDDLNRRLAAQVDKVLKGTKPADIPVEQPTKFKLIINAKTAKALGLVVPTLLLSSANEVIE